jgi:hypothetical protein
MTKTGLINAKEALELLGLYNPADTYKPNTKYLKWLSDRGLLPRIKVGHRKIVYQESDCKMLLEKVKSEGLCLTVNPSKK